MQTRVEKNYSWGWEYNPSDVRELGSLTADFPNDKKKIPNSSELINMKTGEDLRI